MGSGSGDWKMVILDTHTGASVHVLHTAQASAKAHTLRTERCGLHCIYRRPRRGKFILKRTVPFVYTTSQSGPHQRRAHEDGDPGAPGILEPPEAGAGPHTRRATSGLSALRAGSLCAPVPARVTSPRRPRPPPQPAAPTRATHPQLPAADFHVSLLDYVVKVGGHGQRVRARPLRDRLPGVESRRPPPGPRRSRIQPAAATAAPPPASPSSRRRGRGLVAGRPRTGNAARRREQRPPSSFRSSPPPPAASRAPGPRRRQLRAPPPRRRPRQHPRAGASLGGAQLAGAHPRGSPARGEGRAGGAGRGRRAESPARLPPPGPRGGCARRCSQDSLHPSQLGRGAPALPAPGVAPSAPHPAPSARIALPGAGFLRTRLLIPGLSESTPQLDTGERAAGMLAKRRRQRGARRLFISVALCTCIFVPKHTLAFQVFAPLGSANRRRALPGAHKETNRAHVSNPSAAGETGAVRRGSPSPTSSRPAAARSPGVG